MLSVVITVGVKPVTQMRDLSPPSKELQETLVVNRYKHSLKFKLHESEDICFSKARWHDSGWGHSCANICLLCILKTVYQSDLVTDMIVVSVRFSWNLGAYSHKELSSFSPMEGKTTLALCVLKSGCIDEFPHVFFIFFYFPQKVW